LVRFFAGALARVPERIGRPGGRGLGRLVGRLLSRRSRRAADNLRAAFPEAGAAAVQGWVEGMWSNLGEALWEFAQVPRLTPERFSAWVDVDGMEGLRASVEKGKGVILFSGHMANWEWGAFSSAFAGLSIAAVARRMKNPYVNDYLTRIRSSHGVNLFLHKNAVREGMRWVKGGNVLGLLIDQRITAGGTAVTFFGRPAFTTTMPALLAFRTGAAVHGLRSWRESGRLKISITPAMDMDAFNGDAAAATAAMTAELERWIRAAPAYWLWMHDRWKT
jgi:KDO2-lipid IV(A) lauroyltransferase